MLGGLDFRGLAAQIKRLFFVALPEYVYVGVGTGSEEAAIQALIDAMPVGATLRIYGTPRIAATKINVNKRVKVVFEGALGINSTNLPASYLIKGAGMTGPAIELSMAGAMAFGGGVVAEVGATGANAKLSANSTRWDFYFSYRGTYGMHVDGTGNCNHWRLDHGRGYGALSHGLLVTGGVNSNAGLALGWFSQACAGDGIQSDGGKWNSYLACGGDTNTGAGIRLKNGTDNTIGTGDFEANTAGDVIIESTESYTTLLAQNRGSVITDSGFYTRRADRYRDTRGTYYPALRGAGGATTAITNAAIAGTVATMTAAGHGLANGQAVYQSAGTLHTTLLGAFLISNVTANTYDITWRADASTSVPTSGATTGNVQRCGTLATARGDYVVEAGVCEVWGTITTSAVTNITGTVQIVLPFDGAVVDANHNSIVSIDYHSGITYTGRLASLLNQTVAARVANLYDTISGTPGAPAQLQGTGLAAATTIVFRARYRMPDDH